MDKLIIFKVDMVEQLINLIGWDYHEVATYIGCDKRSVAGWVGGEVDKLSSKFRLRFIDLMKDHGITVEQLKGES